MAKNTPQKIKFPIFNNVEYLDILKNKQTIKVYNKEIEGKTWREVSLMIGKEFGGGLYRYTLKFLGNDQIHNGQIRGVANLNLKQTTKDFEMDSRFNNELTYLKNKIESLSNNSNNIGVDVLIGITKSSYETQIRFLEQQLKQKDVTIEKLEQQITKLNDELDNAIAEIDDYKSQTGVNQYLEIAKDFLKLKIPGAVPKISLQDSDSSDIPKQIIDLLGIVDWSQVDINLQNEIIKYLNMFIPKLPLKQR